MWRLKLKICAVSHCASVINKKQRSGRLLCAWSLTYDNKQQYIIDDYNKTTTTNTRTTLETQKAIQEEVDTMWIKPVVAVHNTDTPYLAVKRWDLTWQDNWGVMLTTCCFYDGGHYGLVLYWSVPYSKWFWAVAYVQFI